MQPFNAQEAVQSAGTFFTVDNVGRTLSVAGVGLLLLTLAVAVNRVYQKTNTPEEKRKRLVGALSLLRTRSASLTCQCMHGLHLSLDFSLVFRTPLGHLTVPFMVSPAQTPCLRPGIRSSATSVWSQS